MTIFTRQQLFAIAIALLVSFMPGCCACDELYVAADRFERSVGRQYLGYVENDPKLSKEQKQDKRMNVRVHRRALDRYKETK